MARIIFLCSASLIALTAGIALAGPHPRLAVLPATVHPHPLPPGVLYNQNSNFTNVVDSQNFSASFAMYSSAAADDFVVPCGHRWRITGVDATGMYYNGSGPAASEIVSFYTNKKGRPNKVKAAFTINCADDHGYFSCTLPGKGQVLSGGTKGKRFWLSVVANCDFTTCGQWGWIQNTTTHNDQGQWENPGDGFHSGCTTWADTSTCTGLGSEDYAFDLIGKRN